VEIEMPYIERQVNPKSQTVGSAIFTSENGLIKIELKPVFAPWAKQLFLGSVFYLFLLPIPALIVGIMALRSGQISRAWAAATFVIGIPIFPAFVTLILALTFKNLYGRVDCDGRQILVTDFRAQYQFPVDKIRAIDLVILKPFTTLICPDKPLNKLFRKGPSGALDFATDDGRVRVFRRWGIEELQFVRQILRNNLNLPQITLGEPAAAPTAQVLLEPRVSAGKKWIFPFVSFLLIALFILGFVAQNTYWGFQSNSWPSALGRVTKAVVDRTDSHAEGQIVYSYQVGNQTAENDRISYRIAGVPDSREFVLAHPMGSAVEVYYDPSKITRSTLTRGPGWNDLLYTFFSFTPLFFCFLLLRTRANKQQEILAKEYQIRDPNDRYAPLVQRPTGDSPTDKRLR
jgi:hypothetical protein